ncbi:hypothetical protein [Archangium lipolyticum]|uniref:hypothetical protein n=1 Tax=Archangium lipolyticum TaxID=2970465 RepID=UPI0027D46581|nr:hypothetical protein [Archangium lipolyticum]
MSPSSRATMPRSTSTRFSRSTAPREWNMDRAASRSLPAAASWPAPWCVRPRTANASARSSGSTSMFADSSSARSSLDSVLPTGPRAVTSGSSATSNPSARSRELATAGVTASALSQATNRFSRSSENRRKASSPPCPLIRALNRRALAR